MVFFIGSIAETNRAPFDLAEAESELVSGFMTEHSAVIFVFFFLAEYASIVLICILNSILFLGGYLFDFNYFLYPYFYLLQYIASYSYMYLTDNESNFNVIDFDNYSIVIGTVISGLVIGFKACIMIFVFI
jgi:NADH-ubiquinone oxidoreductase chain 1